MKDWKSKIQKLNESLQGAAADPDTGEWFEAGGYEIEGYVHTSEKGFIAYWIFPRAYSMQGFTQSQVDAIALWLQNDYFKDLIHSSYIKQYQCLDYCYVGKTYFISDKSLPEVEFVIKGNSESAAMCMEDQPAPPTPQLAGCSAAQMCLKCNLSVIRHYEQACSGGFGVQPSTNYSQKADDKFFCYRLKRSVETKNWIPEDRACPYRLEIMLLKDGENSIDGASTPTT